MSKWVYVFVAMINFIALIVIGVSEKRIDMGYLATIAIFAHFAEHEFEKGNQWNQQYRNYSTQHGY